jgi:membrane peptidoglycan carboxypeptidase
VEAEPQLTPQEIELAAQFRETRDQVRVLKQMHDAGQLDYQELQRRLQQLSILDPQGRWWMLGVNTDRWYRYDDTSGQWVESQPPVPLDAGSPRTVTSDLDPVDVVGGSLPQLPTDRQVSPEEFSEDYDPTLYSQAQEQYNEQYGAQPGDTPIPYGGQPSIDPNLTQVGSTFDRTSLSGADPTVQNMNAVPYDATMQSASVYGDQTVGGMMEGAQQREVYEGEPEYNLGQQAPTFEEQAQRERRGILTFVLVGVFALAVFGLVAVIGFVLYVQNLYNNTVEPYRGSIASLANYQPDFQTARILDANGDLIVERTGEEGDRIPVSLIEGEVSPYFIHAVVSSEDPTFYENPGFDLLSVIRAFLQNLGAGEVVSGASTITQQIARNLVLDDTTVSADRKLTEVFVALEIANSYSKNEILDIYINESYFGNLAYGVEAASQFYFEKSASELNMAESALLVGVLPAPAVTDPVSNRDQAFRNMIVIVDRMIEAGCLNFQHGQWADPGEFFCINENTLVDSGGGSETRLFTIRSDGSFGGPLSIQIAQVEASDYQPRTSETRYPHFVAFVEGQIDAIFGPGALNERGFTVQTTLIPRLQDTAERSLIEGVSQFSINGVQTGGVIVIDPNTGAIRALVGSPDFNDETINGQVDTTRTYQQPGSAIKPILYTAAISGASPNGYLTPASILWDVPSRYDVGGQIYEPLNFDRQYRGPVSVRTALQQSLNIPAVKAYQFVGQNTFVEVAGRLGIDFLDEAVFGLPTALGANEVTLIDLTHAYATIANDGRFVPLFAIESIQDSGGAAVSLPERGEPRQVITPQTAYVMQNILSDDSARAPQFGANSLLSGASFGLPNQGYVAAKTGTTDDENDLWTVGFTNNYAVGVWMGTVLDSTSTTGDLTGSRVAAPVWHAVMTEAIGGRDPGTFDVPTGVVQDTVCRLTGTLAPQGSNCPNRVTEIYIQSQPPPGPDEGYVQTIGIDSWTGLRANQWCPENVVQQTFADIDDPFAVSWLNTSGQGILQTLGLPSNLQSPPEQECQQGQPLPTIRLNNPSEGSVVEGELVITGQVSAQDLQRWQLLIAPVNSEQFSAITDAATNQVPTAGTTLTTYDTRQLADGSYTLRLAAYSQSGGFVFDDVVVNIDNPDPTPTPFPTQTPLPTSTTAPIVVSPLPFEEVNTPTPDPFP